MSAFDRLYRLSPIPELIMRWGYYKIYKPLFGNRLQETPRTDERKENDEHSHITLEVLLNKIHSFGIEEGDLLVIHSSANGLADLECNPNDLLNALINMVGSTGTIAMPAFPDESRLKEKDGVKIYDGMQSSLQSARQQ